MGRVWSSQRAFSQRLDVPHPGSIQCVRSQWPAVVRRARSDPIAFKQVNGASRSLLAGGGITSLLSGWGISRRVSGPATDPMAHPMELLQQVGKALPKDTVLVSNFLGGALPTAIVADGDGARLVTLPESCGTLRSIRAPLIATKAYSGCRSVKTRLEDTASLCNKMGNQCSRASASFQGPPISRSWWSG